MDWASIIGWTGTTAVDPYASQTVVDPYASQYVRYKQTVQSLTGTDYQNIQHNETGVPNKPDEFAWLRKRVEEFLWK